MNYRELTINAGVANYMDNYMAIICKNIFNMNCRELAINAGAANYMDNSCLSKRLEVGSMAIICKKYLKAN